MIISSGTFTLILARVAMSAHAHLMLKAGISNTSISESLAARQWVDALVQVVTKNWVVLGLTVYFLSAVVWLAVLAQVEVSFAYPFVGIGFVLTMFLGWLVMDDNINPQRVVGTLLIAASVAVMARGG